MLLLIPAEGRPGSISQPLFYRGANPCGIEKAVLEQSVRSHWEDFTLNAEVIDSTQNFTLPCVSLRCSKRRSEVCFRY